MNAKSLIPNHNLQELNEKDIVLNPNTDARKGWEKAFKKMHENGDDKLMLPDVSKFEDLLING